MKPRVAESVLKRFAKYTTVCCSSYATQISVAAEYHDTRIEKENKKERVGNAPPPEFFIITAGSLYLCIYTIQAYITLSTYIPIRL